jgi:hypothetical protein
MSWDERESSGKGRKNRLEPIGRLKKVIESVVDRWWKVGGITV